MARLRQRIFGARAVLIAVLSTTTILAVSANAQGAKSLSRSTLPPGFASGADVESVEYIFSALRGAKYPADVEMNLLADVERYSRGVVDEKFTPPILLMYLHPILLLFPKCRPGKRYRILKLQSMRVPSPISTCYMAGCHHRRAKAALTSTTSQKHRSNRYTEI